MTDSSIKQHKCTAETKKKRVQTTDMHLIVSKCHYVDDPIWVVIIKNYELIKFN